MKTTTKEKQFSSQELDETNKSNLIKWIKDDSLNGIVDESQGGIIGYINSQHSERVINILNKRLPSNMMLKAVYVCVTNANNWGKGYTPEESKKNARIKGHLKKTTLEYYVQAAIFNKEEMTDEEFKNLFTCITVNQIDGTPMYYDQERTQEDTNMIMKYHIGWMTVEKNY